MIAWTLLDAPSRDLFHATLGPDEDCWARGRGWALWKALIVQRDLWGPDGLSTDGVAAAETHRVLAALLAGA